METLDMPRGRFAGNGFHRSDLPGQRFGQGGFRPAGHPNRNRDHMPSQFLNGRNSRFSTTVQEYDRSADILVRFDRVGKPQADRNVRAPIT